MNRSPLLYLSLALFLLVQLQVLSQTGDTLRMTLDECVQYALKNNTAVKNATLDEEIAAARVREIRGIGLPQINGSAGLQHFFKLRNAYLPGGSPIGVSTDPSTPKPDVLILPAIFQLPTNLDGSINASQLLFNSSYKVGLQAAKTYKELSSRASAQTKEQTALNVKKAYFQNLISLERIKLFDVNISRIDSSLRQLRVMQSNGFIEQIEVDRLEVSLNNLLTEYEKTLNLLILANLQLKFQMGMPIEQPIILKDSLNTFANIQLSTDAATSPSDRVEYQLLKLQVKSYQLDLKNKRGSALPSLALSGSLGAFTSSKNLNFLEKKSIVVVEDFDDPSKTKLLNQGLHWSTYGFVQLGMNVPIFSGFQLSHQKQQSKLNLRKAENNLKNFEQGFGAQVQAAKVSVQNSKRSMEIQKRNMELAKKVSNVTSKKYKAGTGSSLELTNAEASLKEAQINYFNALYDYLVAVLDYETATGVNKY